MKKTTEKHVVVYCCDSNGIEFTINYFPNDQTLVFAFDSEGLDEEGVTFMFTDADTKDFVLLQNLLLTNGEHLTMEIVKKNRLTLVESIEVHEVQTTIIM